MPYYARIFCRLAGTSMFPIAVMSGAAAPAFAGEAAKDASAERLTLTAEVRMFAETIEGQFRPAPAPKSDSLISFRTLIGAQYDLGGVKIVGELDDARGYLEKRSSSVGTTEINALELLQAYVAFDLDDRLIPSGKNTFTVGRFTMDIGSGRLVGRPEFVDSPPSFLGANFSWKSKQGDRLIAFWTMPFDRLPDDAVQIRANRVKLDRATTDRQLSGISITKGQLFHKASGELYVYRLYERDAVGRPTKNRRLITAGGRLFRAPAKGAVDYELEATIQRGETRLSTAATDIRDVDVRSGLFHAEGGWTFSGGWTPRVALLFDYAGGDGADADHYGRFDGLYGGRRIDYGPTSLYGSLGRANIQSVGLTLEGKPGKGWDFFVKGRELWLDQASDSFASTSIRDRTGKSGHHAGAQVEARLRTWLVPKRLRLELDGAYLAKGHFLKAAPNAPHTGDTRYALLGLTASF